MLDNLKQQANWVYFILQKYVAQPNFRHLSKNLRKEKIPCGTIKSKINQVGKDN
jgi:hypothetical protein